MNKIIIWSSVLLMSTCLCINGQEYPVSVIPDSLKANAHCVIRDFNEEMELQSINTATQKTRMVITILDKEGENSAYLAIHYDKDMSVNIKQITLFDANGKKIKNVKQSDINDSPAYGSSVLYSEARIKYFKPENPFYPYTVLYEYNLDMKNVISLGSWHPILKYGVSSQHSQLTFIYPAKIKINRKEMNIHMKESERHSDKIHEIWELTNLKALEQEPYGTSLTERIPTLYLMPSSLLYEKYEGSSDNWQDYGKWMYSLYEGRNDISETEKLKVEALLKEIPDTLEKIRTLYRYLQGNTRYVNITLGLGGFQPFDAKTVFETGYGDCKALSNYMYSLLKLNGIKSYPAIVSCGRYKEKIFPDFPNFQQFDHVILCVPRGSDTIWLECTNQKIPFGFLGDFTDDRDVLLITDKGGKFAHTRNYSLMNNLRTSWSEYKIDSAGTAVCTVKTTYHGLQYDDISDFLNSNYDEQKKWLYSNSSFPSLQIINFSVIEKKQSDPVAGITESEISKNYCSFTGNYMLLPLNLLNVQKPIQKMLKPRYSDIIISRSYADCDTLVFNIPKNYKNESVTSGNTINSKFGSYSSSITANDNKIVFIRKFTILEGRYNPSLYKEYYDFILAVSKADNIKLMLTKKS
jgi:hypothetical protein